jgi:hypothetical protein
MWRCHCGEKNLSADERCRNCNAARLTHEEDEAPAPAPRRGKTVQVSFFGLGGGGRDVEAKIRPRVASPRPGEAPPRAFTEDELARHYAAERRRDLLTWGAWILAALAAVALLAWQVVRSPR